MTEVFVVKARGLFLSRSNGLVQKKSKAFFFFAKEFAKNRANVFTAQTGIKAKIKSLKV